jgi:hypothetical protein
VLLKQAMKIFQIGIIRNTDEKGLELAVAKDLSNWSFFERSRYAY